MKRITLYFLTSLAITGHIYSSGGSGSGFVSSIAPAILLADLTTNTGRSHNNGAQYHDYKQAEEDRIYILQEIRNHEQEITKLQSKLDTLNKNLKNTKNRHQKNKNKTKTISDHEDAIIAHQNAIEDLREELKDLV